MALESATKYAALKSKGSVSICLSRQLSGSRKTLALPANGRVFFQCCARLCISPDCGRHATAALRFIVKVGRQFKFEAPS